MYLQKIMPRITYANTYVNIGLRTVVSIASISRVIRRPKNQCTKLSEALEKENVKTLFASNYSNRGK